MVTSNQESSLLGQADRLARAQSITPEVAVHFKDVLDGAAATLSEIPAGISAGHAVCLARAGAQDGFRWIRRGVGVDHADDEQEEDSNNEDEGEDDTICAVVAARVAGRKGTILRRI